MDKGFRWSLLVYRHSRESGSPGLPMLERLAKLLDYLSRGLPNKLGVTGWWIWDEEYGI